MASVRPLPLGPAILLLLESVLVRARQPKTQSREHCYLNSEPILSLRRDFEPPRAIHQQLRHSLAGISSNRSFVARVR